MIIKGPGNPPPAPILCGVPGSESRGSGPDFVNDAFGRNPHIHNIREISSPGVAYVAGYADERIQSRRRINFRFKLDLGFEK